MIENFSEGEKRWRLTMIERLPRRAARTGKAGSSANAEMRPSQLSVGLNLALLNLAAA